MDKQGREGKGARGWRRVLRATLWALIGLWAIILIGLQVALNSRVLSKVAGRFADEYVDGAISFSSIKASMLRSFPNLNVSVDDFSITYSHERFASFDSLAGAGDSLYHAGHGVTDTLAHFDRLSLSVNYAEALRKRIRVNHAILEHPRIFLHRYDSTSANWDIIRTGESSKDDSSSFNIPPVTIVKASLEKTPFAVYTSIQDALAASLSLDHLTVRSHRGHYDIDLESLVRLATTATGRMELPISIDTKFYPDFEKRTYSLKGLKASVATVDLTGEGMVDMGGENLYIKAQASIDDEPVSEVTEYFGKNFPILKKLRTDARISLQADCDGYYIQETGSLPALEVHLEVPDSFLGWEGIGEEGRFDLDFTASATDGKLAADIHDLCLHIDGADIQLKGSSDDLLKKDPPLKIDSRIHARLDSLARFLPDSLGISASGALDGRLKGEFRISQLDLYNFPKLGLEGNLVSDGIRILVPKDSITAYLGRTTISLGAVVEPAETNAQALRQAQGPKGPRTVLKATVDSLLAEYGTSTFIRGTGVELAVHNTEETMDGFPGKHPLHGHLDIRSMGMMDLDSCFVGVRGSGNTFKLTRILKNGQEVPYLSLSSSNKAIAVRQGANRITAGGVALNAAGHPNSVDSKIRRTHLLDSLQKEYPDVARDSLLRKAFSRRRGGNLPDYLSEKDFEKKDIQISLGETAANYIKNWDISGGFKIKEGKVITPYFPLDNSIADLSGKFSNNRIDLGGLTLRSGESDISASGSLSGLKRALTSSRGRMTLDLDISSDLIDLNELLAAAGAGARFTRAQDKEAPAAAGDTTALSSLIVLPSNLNAKVSVQAGTVRYSDLETSFVSTDLEMKERCLQVTNTLAMTNMGEVFLEGFYSTRTKKDLKAGFDLMLSNITAEKVIELFPAVDSIMPMLKAFKGLLDCEIAATSSIDTAMNIVLPSLNGMIKIDGKNLSLAESEDLDKLRKTLMFKNRDSSYIDAMSVRGIVKDNQLEVFPFILKVDRYTLALNGIQKFDQKFKYHVAALKSPIPFRFGVNLKGSFMDWKWYLGKAKYKSTKIPVFDEQIDELRLNLVNSIHNIFSRGVEQAMLRNERAQEAIEEKKAEVDYSADETEELSTLERKTLETLEKLTGNGGATEGEVKESGE